MNEPREHDGLMGENCAGGMTLPYYTADLPGVGGELKQAPQDFEVEEIPAYEPRGSGEHLFLWIEKIDLSAEQLTEHVARALDISATEIGVAGLKDRRAVTRQFVSVPANREDRIDRIESDQVRVLRADRHTNKLRTGHLRGNRFVVRLRGVDPDAAAKAEQVAERLLASGFPNYFGEQRFGRDAGNVRLGFELLRGEKKPSRIPYTRRRFLLRLSLSSVQSALFNDALATRVNEHSVQTVQRGDVMQVVASGGLFVAEDTAAEQRRLDAGETTITGPLFGPKMKSPEYDVGAREEEILSRWGLAEADFERFANLTTGSRRPYLARIDSLQVVPEGAGTLRFEFTLPPGVYATVLLREFQKRN